jgi:hypothetical protein
MTFGCRKLAIRHSFASEVFRNSARNILRVLQRVREQLSRRLLSG